MTREGCTEEATGGVRSAGGEVGGHYVLGNAHQAEGTAGTCSPVLGGWGGGAGGWERQGLQGDRAPSRQGLACALSEVQVPRF